MNGIAARIEAIFEACEPGLWGTSGVSSWERERLAEWRGRNHLSEKQEDVLKQVEEKVFGGND
jgi:hypothetical protein